jgi:hypothetical protein
MKMKTIFKKWKLIKWYAMMESIIFYRNNFMKVLSDGVDFPKFASTTNLDFHTIGHWIHENYEDLIC